MTEISAGLNRRLILAGGAAAGALGVTAPLAQVAAPPGTPGTKVSISLNGATYIYPDGPKIPDLFVGFREDGRIVFHLGALVPAPPTDTNYAEPHNLPAYSTGSFQVPMHGWNSRWTDRTRCPVKIIRSPADIVTMRRMFPFGNTGCTIPPPQARKPYILMGSSNITTYMPTTGERPEIGLVTDNSALFMLGGSPDAMLDWAYSAESCPVHFRDQSTDRPIDLIKYPQANAYDEPKMQGAPWLVKGPKNSEGNPNYWGNQSGQGWSPQQAHFCEMSYVAHLATGDLGFLEDLQYSANFCVLTDAVRSTPARAVVAGEYRGVAWAIRELFMAHIATKDAEARFAAAGKPWPTWLHPSRYWKVLLDNSLTYYSAAMSDPVRQKYRLVCPNAVHINPWECDYMLSALAFGVLTDHSDWSRLYLWALKNVIDRTSGSRDAGAYPPGYGGAYSLKASAPSWWDALLAGDAPDQPPLTPQQIEALKADPLNGGVAITGHEYLMTTRAVLVMADYLDKNRIAGVRAAYPELDTCLANVNRMVRAYGAMNPRASIVSV